jgi:hypothetical protein
MACESEHRPTAVPQIRQDFSLLRRTLRFVKETASSHAPISPACDAGHMSSNVTTRANDTAFRFSIRLFGNHLH